MTTTKTYIDRSSGERITAETIEEARDELRAALPLGEIAAYAIVDEDGTEFLDGEHTGD